MDPKNACALNGKANCLSYLGEDEKAITIYKEAILCDDANCESLNGIGEVLSD